jgi:hypothetical protein
LEGGGTLGSWFEPLHRLVGLLQSGGAAWEGVGRREDAMSGLMIIGGLSKLLRVLRSGRIVTR